VLRGKFIVINASMKKISSQINNLNLHLRELGNEEQIKAGRRKETKIRENQN